MGVVTVTFNSSSVLTDFLDSVQKQANVNFTLYVIDSGSTDDTCEKLAMISDPRVEVVPIGENIGYAAASNFGIRMALENGCGSIMLLNNDTVFDPEMFRALQDALDTYSCDMTTPKMLHFDPPNNIWAAGGHLNRWLGYKNHHDGGNLPNNGKFDRPRRVTFTPFCCILMRRRVIETLGYLDENYFVYVEDADYCFRAMKAGLSLWYVPGAKLWHKASSLTGGKKSEFSIRFGTRNRVYYMFKNLPMPLAVFWTAIYAGIQFIGYITGGDPRPVWDLKLHAFRQGIRLGKARRSSTRQ